MQTEAKQFSANCTKSNHIDQYSTRCCFLSLRCVCQSLAYDLFNFRDLYVYSQLFLSQSFTYLPVTRDINRLNKVQIIFVHMKNQSIQLVIKFIFRILKIVKDRLTARYSIIKNIRNLSSLQIL